MHKVDIEHPCEGKEDRVFRYQWWMELLVLCASICVSSDAASLVVSLSLSVFSLYHRMSSLPSTHPSIHPSILLWDKQAEEGLSVCSALRTGTRTPSATVPVATPATSRSPPSSTTWCPRTSRRCRKVSWRDTYQHTYLHACAVRLCCAVLCLPEIDSPVITDCLSDWLLLRAWLT